MEHLQLPLATSAKVNHSYNVNIYSLLHNEKTTYSRRDYYRRRVFKKSRSVQREDQGCSPDQMEVAHYY